MVCSTLTISSAIYSLGYHGPPLSGSPLLVGQQKNSSPTKTPPTSPLWISANFEAIRKLKQANSRELIYLRNMRFFFKGGQTAERMLAIEIERQLRFLTMLYFQIPNSFQ